MLVGNAASDESGYNVSKMYLLLFFVLLSVNMTSRYSRSQTKTEHKNLYGYSGMSALLSGSPIVTFSSS